MSVTALAIKRPILFIVFFLLLGGGGIFAYKNLQYELLPDLAAPIISVVTTYAGASPKEVESSVTKIIEDGISGVSKIKKLSASSLENVSIVTIEFLADADADQAVQEVQRAVSKISAEFPVGVKSPAIEKFNVNDLPVLTIGVTASIPETELFTLIKNQVKPGIAQIKSVGRVTILGGAEKEVKIFIDQDKMISYGISNVELSEAIRKTNMDFPAGTIKDKDAQLGIRLSGKITDYAQLYNQPVRVLPDGSSIKISDVTIIKEGTKTVDVISRLNRQPSISLFINKQTGSNAVDVSKLVTAKLSSLEKEYAGVNLKFNVAQDSSEFTLTAANAVYKDFAIAVVLVALVMLIFLHSIRNALIVMLAIPTSLFSAFILMYFMGYSLNLMTLLAMSLVIGILVDDSIVVLENIYKHLEQGKDKVTAALDGRNEIGFAALSITLVDVVVFLPMALVPGLVGSLVKQFSLVIVVSTLSSLLVSFTLTPMIASRFAQLEELNAKSFFGKTGLFFEGCIKRFTDWYATVLGWSLKNKTITLVTALVLLIAAVSLVTEGFIGSEFTPATDKGELSLLVNMQPGTNLSETNKAFDSIENKLKNIPEITKIFSNIGYQNDGFTENYSTHVGAIAISLVPANERNISLPDLGRQIRNLAMEVPGVKARVSPIGLFGANDAPIQLLVYGSNRDSVFTNGNSILDSIRSISGVVNPRLSAEQGKSEIDISIDREKAAQLGLNMEVVGVNLRNAINGYDDLKFRSKEEEIAVRVQLKEDERSATASLNQYSFINDKGQLVYLNQFAKVVLQSGPNSLERRNKQASVMVLCQVAGRPSGDVGEDIKNKLATLKLSGDVKITYEGDLELQDNSFEQLGLALLTSFVLIYLIMVSLYNNWSYPLVVLFSIPLAVIGAFLALALTANSFSIFTIFGLIMMMGLVAKNAILLVDKANEVFKESSDLTTALIEASVTRLRPILMTTLAMVIGMLPLALAKGAAAELNSGLAWVIIGGLSSSMLLTLVVVPVIYYLLTRLLEKIERWKNKRKTSPSGKVLAQLPKIAGVLIVAILLGNSIKAQTVSLSIDEAVAKGLAYNIQIKLAELEELKGKYTIKEAQSNLYPNIAAAGTYNRNIKAPVFFFPQFQADSAGGVIINDKNLVPLNGAAKNYYSATATVSMPVWNKEVNSSIRAAAVNEKLIKANTLVSKYQLADEIRKACYNLLINEAGKELVAQAITRGEIALKSAKNLYTQGMVFDADTLAAFVNLESLKINRFKSTTSINQSSNYLKNLLGIPLNSKIIVTDNLTPAELIVEPLHEALQNAAANRPEISQNNIAAEAAKAQLLVEKSRYYPNLGFIAQYQIQTQANNFKFKSYDYPNSFFVGLQLNIPIFSGFKNDIRVKQGNAAVELIKLQKEQLTAQIALEVNNAQLALQETYATWQSQTNIIPSAQRSLQLITARWQKGIAKYSDVADAELTLIQVKNNQLQAAYNYFLAKVQYLKATNTSQ